MFKEKLISPEFPSLALRDCQGLTMRDTFENSLRSFDNEAGEERYSQIEYDRG